MAETEQRKGIGEVAKKIEEIIATNKAAAEAAPPPSASNPINTKKIEVRELAKEMQLDPEKAHMRMQVAPKESIDVTEGHARVTAAITKSGAEVSWLISSPTELNHNTQAMVAVARIVAAPVALRDDPHFLLSEGARLFWSTDWNSLTPESGTEVRMVLQRIYLRIDEIKDRTPDFTVEDKVIKENILGEKEKLKKNTRTEKLRSLGDDLFKEFDSSKLGPQDQRKFEIMKQVLNKSSESIENGVSEQLVRSYIDQAEDMLKRAIKEDAPVEAKLQSAEMVTRLRDKLTSYINEDRIPSTIMLSRDEVMKIIADPIGFLESMSRDITLIADEHGFDSPIIEQRLNRYHLITDYLVSDTYNAEHGIRLEPGLSVDKLREFHDKHATLLKVKGEILNQYTVRVHALEFMYFLQQAADLEKDTQLQRVLGRIGEKGAYGLRAQLGGSVAAGVTKMRRIHDELLRDPEFIKIKRSTPEVMKEVRRRVSAELLAEQAIWEPRISQSFTRLIKDQNDVISKPEMPYNKQFCDTITILSESSYRMFFEKEQIMLRGAPPGFANKQDKISSFETESAEEKLLGTLRFRDGFLRKWNNAIAGQRASWNLRSLWYVHKDPALREWASEKTTKLFDKLQNVSSSWKDAVKNGDTSKITEQPLYHELSTIFSEYEEINELTGGKDILFFSRLSKNKLYRQVACDIGGEITQLQGARCYGYWDSLPRRDVINEVLRLHPLLKDKKGLGVGMDLFGTGRAWFLPERVRTEEVKKKFIESLEKGLQYQPHFFYKLKHMREEIALGAPATAKLEEVSQRFDLIQSILMISGEGSIDYSSKQDTWSEGQRKIVHDCFELVKDRQIVKKGTDSYTLSQQEYIDQMKAYHKELNPSDFTHVKYTSDFATVLFNNDVPMAALENPNVLDRNHIAITLGEEAAKAIDRYSDKELFMSISHHSTDRGDGANGLWRRSWSDAGKLSATIPLQLELLKGNDEKAFLKALGEMSGKVGEVQGPTDSAKTALEAIVGYIEAAKVKPGYTSFLKGLKNSSIMKEYWGDEAKSLALDEVSGEYDKFDLLMGKLGKQIPGADEWAKDYLGISSWRRVLGLGGLLPKFIGEEKFDKLVEKLNENMPNSLYAYKARNVALFALVIMMLFAVDQAKKGTEAPAKK